MTSPITARGVLRARAGEDDVTELANPWHPSPNATVARANPISSRSIPVRSMPPPVRALIERFSASRDSQPGRVGGGVMPDLKDSRDLTLAGRAEWRDAEAAAQHGRVRRRAALPASLPAHADRAADAGNARQRRQAPPPHPRAAGGDGRRGTRAHGADRAAPGLRSTCSITPPAAAATPTGTASCIRAIRGRKRCTATCCGRSTSTTTSARARPSSCTSSARSRPAPAHC